MLSVLSFCKNENTHRIIEKSCRNEVAIRTDDYVEFLQLYSKEELKKVHLSDTKVDIVYFEIDNSDDVELLKQMRSEDSNFVLMLMTSPGISPLMYLKPGISPQMLVLVPFHYEEFEGSNKELFDSVFSQFDETDKSAFFTVKTSDGKIAVPYEKITLFEASNKKVYLRVGKEEYEFYGSIENITQMVPDYFVRCHRSFLINIRKVTKLSLTEGVIEMTMNTSVPLSRSYKKAVKEKFG